MSSLHLNAEQVKSAATGRELELLEYVAHIDRDYLDGKPHPCPKCGGKDRFRLVDAKTGAVFCNQCFSTKNGDFLAAIQHFRGISFPRALEESAYRLGIIHSLDGGNGSGKPIQGKTQPDVDPVIRMATMKRCPVESLRVFGGMSDPKSNAAKFPEYSDDGKQCSTFTVWPNSNDEKFRKGLNEKGKPAGLFFPHDMWGDVRLPQAGETWILVEGVKDSAALHGMGYPNVCGLNTSSLSQKFAKLFAGVHVIVIPDPDEAGDKGAPKTAKNLQGVAASVKVASLPVRSKDVRDHLALDGGVKLVRDAIENASQAEPTKQATAAAVQCLAAAVGTLVRPADRDNVGDVVEDLGDRCRVHFLDPNTGNQATVEFPKTELRLTDGTPLASNGGKVDDFPPIRSYRQLAAEFPTLRQPVIHDLLRIGETLNIVSLSKYGKSWLIDDLALAITAGQRWLDTFDVEQGQVLICDNELHEDTIRYRIKAVADARGIPEAGYADRLDTVSFRGKLRDIFELEPFFRRIESGKYKLLVVDAIYRFYGSTIDENSNSDMARFYNQLDRYAGQLNCGVAGVHHATKGSQSNKSATDVGSGAGAQSRAADTHLILRPHAEDGAVVLEAVCRSFPPVEPRVLRWEWPVWTLAADLDPACLKSDRSAGQDKLASIKADILKAFVHFPDGATKKTIQGYTGRPAAWERAMRELLDAGDVKECDVPSKSHRKPDPGYQRVYNDEK